MVAVAHANDGGGSIRIPASCCGLVGLKPSRGRTSLLPDYSVIDDLLIAELCVTRTVRDTAGVLDALHGGAIGDTVRAPAPARPYRDEVSPSPCSPGRASCASVCSRTTRSSRARSIPTASRPRTRPRNCWSRSATPWSRRFRLRSIDPELVGHFTTLWAGTLVLQPPLLGTEGGPRDHSRRRRAAHVDARGDGARDHRARLHRGPARRARARAPGRGVVRVGLRPAAHADARRTAGRARHVQHAGRAAARVHAGGHVRAVTRRSPTSRASPRSRCRSTGTPTTCRSAFS